MVGDLFVSRAQMNTIAIIVHQEYPFTVKSFLERKKNPFVKSLLFCRFDRDGRKLLGLQSTTLGNHLKALPDIVSNFDQFSFPVGVIDILSAFGFFCVEKSSLKISPRNCSLESFYKT
jgi:hypothetical protein